MALMYIKRYVIAGDRRMTQKVVKAAKLEQCLDDSFVLFSGLRSHM
jgi:hypothetical protein